MECALWLSETFMFRYRTMDEFDTVYVFVVKCFTQKTSWYGHGDGMTVAVTSVPPMKPLCFDTVASGITQHKWFQNLSRGTLQYGKTYDVERLSKTFMFRHNQEFI